ncbi:hypothetical protein AAU57_08440 [Nonlabens sp. YIK11]|uniref:hypothetical protein n=1 Tax=Nonlabens sp. YIK11 TaxID=1453349 RepID=UPI0006DC1626|nr:hypothetical protein [Nonlabens sp. YIK11]KQC33339.1 hypothetical protein AAU57_08440 [Nonlabens sp. YIK11]
MYIRLILALLALGCAITSTAQEKYKATYDYQTDQLLYFTLDRKNQIIDTIDNTKLKRGSVLMVEVKNVNPFALKIETTVEEEKLHDNAGSFGFGNLLGSIQNITGGGLQLNTPDLPVSDLAGLATNSRGGNAIDDLKSLTTNVKALKKMILSNMKNPNLTKEDILRNIKNLAAQNSDPRLPDPEDNLYLYLETLDQLIASEVQNLNSIVDDSYLGNTSRGETVKKSLNSYSIQNTDEVSSIVNLYSSIEAATFSQVYDYRVTADNAVIEMNFIPKSDNLEETTTSDAIKVRSIPVKAKGGFKINSSVALTLNNYTGNSNDYFVDANGDIGSTPDDSFVPNLSTMINFYPILADSFNIGGSFGLSIPIADDLTGVNFILGPSIFLGNKNRFSLSGGVAFGPVKQLTNGLEVGDVAISNDVDSFTKNKYDLGYYFGISFSLFDLN